MPKYIKGNYIHSTEKVSLKELEEYFLITNLRLEQGFESSKFKKCFGVTFEEKYYDKIFNFELNSFFDFNNDKVCLNDEGLLMMDFILVKLFQ